MAAAATTLLLGCGGGSGGAPTPDPDTSAQPQFDDGLFESGIDVSSVAAFEGAADELALDATGLAVFLEELDQSIFQVGTLGIGGRAETLLSIATATSGDDGSRRAQREARRAPSLSTFSSIAPSAGGTESGEFTIECPGGGEFTEKFSFTETIGETSLLDEGGFTWTFDNCTTEIDGDAFVLSGTWSESYEYEDQWTVANGSGSGSWSDTFLTEINLRGSRNGAPNVLVIDGAVSGEETGDYEWSSTGYAEEGVFALNVNRLEARLTQRSGDSIYIGQLDGALIEEFDYRETETEWIESGRTRVSGRIASTGMKGAATISTEKVVRFTDSSLANGDACPDEGIVVVSGAGGNTVEIRFGKDTGTTGVAVQVVTAGSDFESYFSCNDVEYLGPLLFGPFIFAYDDVGLR